MPIFRSIRLSYSRSFIRATAFLSFVFLLGGGSRADIASLWLLRAVGAIAFVMFLARLTRQDFLDFRWPLAIGFGALALAGLHLIPLPFSVWSALPGREIIVQIDAAVGLDEIWRPLSIAPPRTANAIFALLLPLAAMFAMIRLDTDEMRRMLAVTVCLGVLSAILGLFQVVGGSKSLFYLYDVTNYGSAVGLFSNRNHQAAFLATLFPMLAAIASRPGASLEATRFRLIVCGVIAFSIIPLLLVTGSRGGLLWGLAGLAGGLALFRSPLRKGRPLRRGARRVPIGLVAGGLIVAAAIGLLSSRTESLSRLMATSNTSEIRAETFWPVFALARDVLPLGTGVGTFVEAYERIEPNSMLSPTYLNHAHNDFLELLVTGGIPAILLIAAGLAWTALAGLRAWQHLRAGHPGGRTAIAGAAVIFILAAASVLDYPLRTPALACLLASAAVWLCASAKARTLSGN